MHKKMREKKTVMAHGRQKSNDKNLSGAKALDFTLHAYTGIYIKLRHEQQQQQNSLQAKNYETKIINDY